jgi:hypothetical protein
MRSRTSSRQCQRPACGHRIDRSPTSHTTDSQTQSQTRRPQAGTPHSHCQTPDVTPFGGVPYNGTSMSRTGGMGGRTPNATTVAVRILDAVHRVRLAVVGIVAVVVVAAVPPAPPVAADANEARLATPATTHGAISAGEAHTCAIAGVGFMCWGSDDFGELGNRASLGNIGSPKSLLGTQIAFGDSVALTAGSGHTCATGLQPASRARGVTCSGVMPPVSSETGLDWVTRKRPGQRWPCRVGGAGCGVVVWCRRRGRGRRGSRRSFRVVVRRRMRRI